MDSMVESDPFAKDMFADMWDGFADCDYQLIADLDAFEANIERAGLAELVPVDDDALEDPFAAEKGIEPGGMVWRLTAAGLVRYKACRAALSDTEGR